MCWPQVGGGGPCLELGCVWWQGWGVLSPASLLLSWSGQAEQLQCLGGGEGGVHSDFVLGTLFLFTEV